MASGKNTNLDNNVEVERNINNAVANKLANPHKTRENTSFSFLKNCEFICSDPL